MSVNFVSAEEILEWLMKLRADGNGITIEQATQARRMLKNMAAALNAEIQKGDPTVVRGYRGELRATLRKVEGAIATLRWLETHK